MFSPLNALVTTVLFWTHTWSVNPRRASAWIVPSSCQGVVFAAGNGKCQEMLSLRIVVCPGASAVDMPARSTRRSMSEKMLSTPTLRSATVALLATGDLRIEDDLAACVLLHDGKKARIEEPDLEQDEERHRAVDLVRERVEHGPREVEA